MRVLTAILALFPAFLSAQVVGTYQITSGSYSGADETGEVAGNGFAAGISAGGPELLSATFNGYFIGGTPPLNFCFSCGLPGTDDGVAELAGGPLNNPALAGLVQSRAFVGYLESGGLTVSPTIDVIGPGDYTAPFTFSADLAYGPSFDVAPTKYVDVLGHGTVTLDIGPRICANGPDSACSPFQIESLNYTFAPEIDPKSVGSAMTLFCGVLLVARGQRRRAALAH